MADEMTPQQYLAAQAKNYSEYVAATFIYVNGALAYAPGHPVSSVSVEDGTVDRSLVHEVGQDAAPAPAQPAPAAPVPPPAPDVTVASS